jgi:hypothetical protein
MNRRDMATSAFFVTSTDSSQSSLWIGQSGGLQVSVITEVLDDKLYFTSSVTLQNIGTDVFNDVYCNPISPMLFFV